MLVSRAHLVSEEVNLGESLGFDVVQGVRLVPAYSEREARCQKTHAAFLTCRRTLGEHVKGDLATDRVGQAEMGKFLLEDLDHLGSNAGLL